MTKLTSAQIDKDLAPVLRDMEKIGVKINVGYLEGLAADWQAQLESLEERIIELVGHPFRVSSPKQLSEVLFTELNLGAKDGVRLRKKATGFSTDAGTLEKLRDAHPIIPLILEFREVGKLLSTYVEPLPKMVDGEGRLHTHYAPDAASGRLSSKQPNLQNIPTRTEAGRKIRRAFVAEDGWCLLAADYSQVQLRIMAHLSGDETMQQVFKSGGDIHKKTSDELGVDRRTAKAVNFGILYGLTSYGLAESLNVSREEAQSFIDGFLSAYPGVAKYMDKLIADAREEGFSETMFGKKRSLPELDSMNEYLRKAAERIALNHPIQGAEAEIMKIAMIDLAKQLEGKDDIRMILQVHDELVFEVLPDKIENYKPIIAKAMEEAVTLDVPLVVDFKTGTNWAEMEK